MLQAQEALKAQIERIGPIPQKFVRDSDVDAETVAENSTIMASTSSIQERCAEIPTEFESDASIAAASIEDEINELIKINEMNEILIDSQTIEKREWDSLAAEQKERAEALSRTVATCTERQARTKTDVSYSIACYLNCAPASGINLTSVNNLIT